MSARLSSSSSVVMRATTATVRSSTRAALPRGALFFEIVGATGVGFGRGQREIEETHGDHLAEFRVGHAHEDPDRFLNLANLGLFG